MNRGLSALEQKLPRKVWLAIRDWENLKNISPDFFRGTRRLAGDKLTRQRRSISLVSLLTSPTENPLPEALIRPCDGSQSVRIARMPPTKGTPVQFGNITGE